MTGRRKRSRRYSFKFIQQISKNQIIQNNQNKVNLKNHHKKIFKINVVSLSLFLIGLHSTMAIRFVDSGIDIKYLNYWILCVFTWFLIFGTLVISQIFLFSTTAVHCYILENRLYTLFCHIFIHYLHINIYIIYNYNCVYYIFYFVCLFY